MFAWHPKGQKRRPHVSRGCAVSAEKNMKFMLGQHESWRQRLRLKDELYALLKAK